MYDNPPTNSAVVFSLWYFPNSPRGGRVQFLYKVAPTDSSSYSFIVSEHFQEHLLLLQWTKDFVVSNDTRRRQHPYPKVFSKNPETLKASENEELSTSRFPRLYFLGEVFCELK